MDYNRPCLKIFITTKIALQVYAVNNFGIGSPGVTTFQIPKGLLSNTSHLNAAIITEFRWLFKVIIQ